MTVRRTTIILVICVAYIGLNFAYTLHGNVGHRWAALAIAVTPVLFIRLRSDEFALLVGAVGLSTLFVLKLLVYEEFYLTGMILIPLVFIAIALQRVSFSNPLLSSFLASTGAVVFSLWVLYGLYISGVATNEMTAFSRNTITTISLSTFVLTLLLCREVSYESPVWWYVICAGLMVAVVSIHMGRTGILTSLFTLFILAFILYKKSKGVAILFSCVILSLAYYFSSGLMYGIHELPALMRIAEMGTDSPRWMIWSTVLEEIGSPRTLLGLESDLSTRLTGYAWHNGYLQAYSFYGAIGFMVLVAFLIACQYRAFLWSTEIGLAVAAVLVRAFFDDQLINPYVGIILVLVWLPPMTYYFSNRKSQKNKPNLRCTV